MREDHESWWQGINDNKWRRIFSYPNYTYAWFDAYGGTQQPYGYDKHDTHVGGIAIGGDGYAGNLRDIGVAPGAKLIACTYGEYQYTERFHECFQWIVDLTNTPYGNLAPDVVNCSWGNPFNMEDLEYWSDVTTLRELDIIPVFCIGNVVLWINWPPGNFSTSIGVGATDVNDDWAIDFSGYGLSPTNPPWNEQKYWSRPDWNFMGVDLVAPGTKYDKTEGIYSADKDDPHGYIHKWGTSQATPHVTGPIALMLEASRDKWHYDLNYYDIYDILLETANRDVSGSPNIYYGWARLDCYAAVNGVLNYHLKSSDPVATGPNNAERIGYGNGLWHMVYESGGPMAKYVRYTVSADNGATWSLEANGAQGERIGKIGEGNSPALSVLPNGDAHVV
uniref:Peptidase S8/S53 domain-containing protein n=1 Tax=candidate division WOR-3 bacterium TaxID=2052148 RepID=A0A7V1EHQ0_UNCW3